MENKQEVTVPMPGDMHENIIDNLEYGDSKAGWIREAIQMRLDSEAEDGGEEAKTDGGSPVLAD